MVYLLLHSDDLLALNIECIVISSLRQIQKGKVNSLVGLERQFITHSKGSFRDKEELIIDFEKT